MSTKDQAIIEKLVKIASNQQKILLRLAQAGAAEAYLKSAAQVAAANSGFTATEVVVTYAGGHNEPGDGSAGTVNVEGGYTVSVAGAPKDNKVREQFVNTFKKQVQTQKPELGKNLSVLLPG